MANPKRGSKQGRRDTQRESAGTGDKDLKRREYRDEHGDVHHHTKKYMEQHEGKESESEREEED